MDLKLSPQYGAFRDEVRAFLAAHRDRFPVGQERVERARTALLDWQRLLIEHGYAARTVPRDYGGYGAEPDILKSRIIAEAFTQASAPAGLANQGVSMLVPTLLEMAGLVVKLQGRELNHQLAALAIHVLGELGVPTVTARTCATTASGSNATCSTWV